MRTLPKPYSCSRSAAAKPAAPVPMIRMGTKDISQENPGLFIVKIWETAPTGLTCVVWACCPVRVERTKRTSG
ncbi:hypothetical protein RvY_03606 [Ramazzottius varieornatus]|uniref:Uncharacterized protein n=1 Tax=Ramazzottius varieornatus TaxID=947166 RepID=A0A1D1UNQ0_RAMVA|nr:hypothetical protein RvY_03606 [Ramazzottius varieornatus]